MRFRTQYPTDSCGILPCMINRTLHFNNREIKETSILEPQEVIKRHVDEIYHTEFVRDFYMGWAYTYVCLERAR